MSLFDTLFPPQTRAMNRSLRGSERSSRGRRSRRLEAFASEQLERRLALAVTFNPRFTVNAPGDITFAANTLMTAFPGDPGSPSQVIAAQNGTGTNSSVWNDDFWNMGFVNEAGGVISSSSATLSLPVDANVLFAGLYYGARTNVGVSPDAMKTVKFKSPTSGSYVTLTGAAGPNQVSLLGVIDGGVTNLPGTVRTYGAFADVTDLVESAGAGVYAVADVTGDRGFNHFAGWSLVVAYEAPGANLRNLTVFDGFADVSRDDNPDVEIEINGFTAPPAGPVKANLGFVSYEGDLGIVGDTASLNGTRLFNDRNPETNFFNSSISTNNVTVTTKTPNYLNQLGFDADILNIDGLIANGATTALLELTTQQDQYYPSVVTSAIDLYAPKLTVAKSVVDVNGGIVEPGDTLRYTITVANGSTAFDTAANLILTDAIPAFTTYKPGSMFITDVGSAVPVAKTDAIDADQAEALPGGVVPPTTSVRFQLGTDAGGGSPPVGGELKKGESTSVTFDVTVNAGFPSEGLISNTAIVDYTSKFTLKKFTASATAAIRCPPVADLKIEKTDSPATSYVPGQLTTYTLTVTNLGPASVPASMITDILPAGTSFDPSLNIGWVQAGGVVMRPTDPLAAGASKQYTLKLLPASNRTGDLVNPASIAVPAGFYDPVLTNNTSTDTSLCTPSADLFVQKSRVLPAPPLPVVAGEKVTYEIVVTNNGPSSVASFSFVDTPPLLSVTYDVSTGTYASGVWTAASGDTFDPTESVTFTISGTIPSGATGLLINEATATPPKGVDDPNPDNNTSTVTDTIVVKPGLKVTKTDKTDTYVPGTSTTYTIIVTNDGPSDLVNGTVFDELPKAALSGSWTATPSSGASVSEEAGVGNIDVTVNIPIGESVEFTYTVDTKPNPINPDGTYADLVNEVTVTPPAGQGDGTSATDIDEAKPSADLFVQKSRVLPAPPLPVVAGEKVTYEIVVTNNGVSSVASFSFVDTPPLLSVTYDVSTGTYASGVWTAASGDTFDPTESVTFTISGTIPSGATGLLINEATATPPKGVDDPNPDNNTSTVTDTLAVETQFTLSKDDGTDRYTPGTSTTYKIIVTNKGPSFLKGGLVEDLLPKPQGGSASWIASTVGVGSSVSPDIGGNNINATIDLPVGGTATFFYTLNILSTAVGQLDNTVTVKPAPGTIGLEVSVTDSNLPPTPPLSVNGGLVIGSDDGCNGPPFVRILDPNGGQTVRQFPVYELSFRGSVRVATGDVTGDGVEEILVAPGRGRVGEIRVYTQLGVELEAYRTFPFGTQWRGGVEVTAADIDGDGVKDIVAGMSGSTGMVSGFLVTPAVENPIDPVANNPAFSFRGFPPRYAGGVMLSAGDFGTYSGGVLTSPTLDVRDEIVVGSNSGRVATVNVWDVSGTPRIVRTILPFGTRFKGGVSLSVANYDNADNVQDIFVGAGIGGKSAVAIFSGATGGLITRLPAAAFGSFSRPNATVFTAALDLSLTGDGPVTNVYGVQGRNGGRGTRGVSDFTKSSGVTALLPNSTGNLPPLRIAPLKRRLL